MNLLKIILGTFTLLCLSLTFAEEGHDHNKKENQHKDGSKHDDHKDGDKHDDHKDGEKHEEHGGGKAVGEGKAIVEVDEKKGFKLSKEAIKSLNVKLQNVEGDQFFITKATLVASKSEKGVYRFRSGFFKLLPAKILKEEKNGYEVKVEGVDFGDQIVINGVGLLRVTDIYSTDKAEYGHAH